MPLEEESIPVGPSGQQGRPGPPGKDGKDGIDGKDGEKGEKGDPGERGPMGMPGDIEEEKIIQMLAENPTFKGAPGDQGVPGQQGSPGKDGAPGKDGRDGVGLQYQWSSQNPSSLGVKREDEADYAYRDLRGQPGKNGEKGDPGIQGQPGKDGVNGTNGLDGAPGKDGINGKDGAPGPAGKDGAQGLPGDTKVKYAKTHAIAAQTLQGSYTMPGINLGAGVFTNKPVVSGDIETAASNVVLSVRFAITGTSATGFIVTPTISAMNTTVSILILGSVNLLASIPACTLHLVATEPN